MDEIAFSNWPTDSHLVTQHYGENTEYYRDMFGITSGHNGIDIGLVDGKPIYAVADGEVIGVGFDTKGFGNWVLVAHGTDPITSTLYAHLSEARVKERQLIKAGHVIGLGGNTGVSTGPHLHFGLRVNQEEVDPWPYLQALDKKERKHDGWVWEQSTIVVIGQSPLTGLNLRQEPIVTSDLVKFVKPGERFQVVGAAVNGYLPVKFDITL